MKEKSSNGSTISIAQAIAQMEAEQGENFSLKRINLAELERRTGISRGKLRQLKKNGFQEPVSTRAGKKHSVTKLTGYTGIIDNLLRQGVKNSSVCFERLQQAGYSGRLISLSLSNFLFLGWQCLQFALHFNVGLSTTREGLWGTL